MKFSKIALAVMGMAGALSAHAGFDTVEIRSEVQAPKQQGYGNYAKASPETGVVATDAIGLTQIGVPDEKILPVKGFAKEVPLLTALKQIVPAGWHAKKNGELDVYALVSWRGDGSDWVRLLDKLARENNFSVVLDWRKRELTVGPGGWTAVPAPEMIKATAAPAKKAEAKAVPVAYILVPGKTLRENVEEWAQASGYKVIWSAADYPVTRQIEFKGDLVGEGGPLYQLVEAFRTAEEPIGVSVLAGKVIKVFSAAAQTR